MDGVDGIVKMMTAVASTVETETQERRHPMPKIKEKDPLSRKLKEMLCESTGAHILDSGGAYGRHWEENRSKNFDEIPAIRLNIGHDDDNKVNELYFTINVYHFLKNCLEMPDKNDPILKLWKKWVKKKEGYWLEVMESFPEYLAENTKMPIGEYGHPQVYNTYNGECCLSQVLQYLYFEADGRAYVLLQIHNGCDVRGGYTDPELFYTDESIFRNTDAYIACSECGKLWFSDDGHNYYPQWEHTKKLSNLEDREDLFVNAEGKIICPECKKGVLDASL